MDQVYNEKKDCCGCSACYNGCPVSAIEMVADFEGFQYPVINEDLCIDCYWCRRICPFINSGELKEKLPTLYYSKHKEESILLDSTSGGAFTGISDLVLKENGVVFGAVFDENFIVKHIGANNKELRNKMRKSKYSQSELGILFKEIQDLLTRNIKVLFTGTPCQVAGLKGFLNNLKWDENLLLVDLVCHSIPSPKVFSDYLNLIEEEEKKKITWIDFRYKDVSWSRENSNKGFKYKTEGSDEIKTNNLFYEMFFQWKTIMRPSCEICHFADIHRVGDLTIGDYFGIEEYDKSLYDEKGVSFILVNTEKGKYMLDKLENQMVISKRNLDEIIKHQERVSEPVKFPEDRKDFWIDYEKIGFKNLIKNWMEL